MPSAREIDAARPYAAARHAVPGFCARHFGLRGTLRLHRAALGWDLLRAPANVMLAPVALVAKLLALGLRGLGARRAAGWLASRPLMLRTAVAARIEALVQAEVLAPLAADPRHLTVVGAYGGTRTAVAEITTSLGALGTGAMLFKTVTPGVVSLAPAFALSFAQATAIATFPLGGALGAGWYGLFPVRPEPGLTIGLAVGLAVLAAIFTTFAGILADPIQQALGLHRRRLTRLIDALERAAARGADPSMPAPEHYLARLGDIADAGAVILRSFRP